MKVFDVADLFLIELQSRQKTKLPTRITSCGLTFCCLNLGLISIFPAHRILGNEFPEYPGIDACTYRYPEPWHIITSVPKAANGTNATFASFIK